MNMRYDNAKDAYNKHVVYLARDNSDHLLPHNFFIIMVRRFFPVMCVILLTSAFCIAVSKGDLMRYMLYDNTAFYRGVLVSLWCGFPAFIWILLASNPMFVHTANLSYKILAGLLQFTILLSYLLFPEMEIYGMRSYLILSCPAFFLIYYLFVVDPIPLEVVYPLNALGVCALIWMFSMEGIMEEHLVVGSLQAVH
ncbi:MAG: hypothetical protein ACLFU1_06180 [Alphaproteobacteria bacterium]